MRVATLLTPRWHRVSQQHQPAVRVRLILRSADESGGSGSGSGAINRHPEGVKQHQVGHSLSRVCAPERVLVRELAGCPLPLAQDRREGRITAL